jgi:hypothetical protein
MLPKLQELADGHTKLLHSEEESTYHIPTIANSVTVMGSRDGIVSPQNEKLIPSESDPLMNLSTKPSSLTGKYKLVVTEESHSRGCAVEVKI